MPLSSQTAYFIDDPIIIIARLTPDNPLPAWDADMAEGANLGVSAMLKGYRSGLLNYGQNNPIDPALPTDISFLGISKNGWGALNYNTASRFSLEAYRMQAGYVHSRGISVSGGPAQDLLLAPTDGHWPYKVSSSINLLTLAGGAVTYTPTWQDLDGFWGWNGANVGYAQILGTTESPVTPWSFSYSKTYTYYNFDFGDGTRNQLFAQEVVTSGGTALDINFYYLYDFPVDEWGGGLNDWYPMGTCFQPGVTHSATMMSRSVDDVNDPHYIFTEFDPQIPIWSTPPTGDPATGGVMNSPVYTHFIPLVDGIGDFSNWNFQSAVRDGYIIYTTSDLTRIQYYLVNRQWTEYREIQIFGGEAAWCNLPDGSVTPLFITQDVDGTFLIVTDTINGTQIWYAGTAESGFTGCDFDLYNPPPEPTVRVPNVPLDITGTPQLRAWTFTLDDHDFYVLRLGLDFTMVYDTLTQQWQEWTSYNNAVWSLNCGFEWVGGIGLGGSDIIVGDDTTGTLYFLDPASALDDASTLDFGTENFERIAMGQVPVRGREAIPCYATWLTTEMGQPDADGSPVTLYTSDDAGENWVNHGSIGVTTGSTIPELSWYSLGQIQAPGRLFMIIDDGAIARIDTLEMADPNGG